LGDVDRSHSSPVYDASNNEVFAAIYKGQYDVSIPDVYSVGNPMYVPFNVNTNGSMNNGLQFELKYDVAKVNFDEIVSSLDGPWLQYVTHDNVNGIIRFGAMNNQKNGSLQGVTTPFSLKFTAKNPTDDITTNVVVRKLMDASDKEGDHLNINLTSQRIVLQYRRAGKNSEVTESTAKIYPNPNNGNFNVEIELTPKTTMNASIYDYQGNLKVNLGDYTSEEVASKFTTNVTIPEVSSGAYLLVLSGYNKRITKPFIKI
jgi:hypothetical protein